MKTPGRNVLLLHEDSVLRAQLKTGAAGRQWQVTEVQNWEALSDKVRSAPASSIVVVDPYYGMDRQHGMSIELAALLNRFPSLTVAAALAVVPGRLDDLRKLGEWGVVQVIDLEEEATSWAVLYRLNEARGRPLIALIETVLPVNTGGGARSILRAAARVVIDGGAGSDLARALHITPRTLLRWCRKAGLPAPRKLLAWLRMLLAAELLDDPGRSVMDAALACGYASDGSLRNAMRNFLDQSPTGLRERGAFGAAAEEFLVALREARSPTVRYRSAR